MSIDISIKIHVTADWYPTLHWTDSLDKLQVSVVVVVVAHLPLHTDQELLSPMKNASNQ